MASDLLWDVQTPVGFESTINNIPQVGGLSKEALMSQDLYALVILQGPAVGFHPGYTTTAECMQHYGGPTLFASRMTRASPPGRRFLGLPKGGFRTVGKISSEESVSDTSVHLKDPHRVPAVRYARHL